MNKNQLLTYAILMVNDNQERDYYENFVPLIKEAIRKNNWEVVSASEIKKELLNFHKLDLPVSVISTILKRRLRPRGYLKLQNHAYYPNYDKLEDFSYSKQKNELLDKHEKLVAELLSFAYEKYDLEWSEEEAEISLENFIERYQLPILESSLKGEDIIITDRNDDDLTFVIVAAFVTFIQERGRSSFNYLIDIVKGTMLANAVYFSDPSQIDKRFKGTEVYFDTSFLIYALGLSGQARQEPCIELLTMLKESRAILRCFRHNIEEMIGILEWCKKNLSEGKRDGHGTIENFINQGYNSYDIERKIFALDKEIEEVLKIRIIDHVPFEDHKYVIAESSLKEYLRSKINYSRENALEKDVQSISSIVRLRKGKNSLHIENSRAIFITTNYSLFRQSSSFFFNEDSPKYIPPVLHDSVITNLVWLKNPSKAPDLPTKRLIAECYAASLPREHLWNRYLEVVKLHEKTHDITEEDLVLLRYSQGAKELLIEKTLGEEDAVTIGKVQEILSEIKLKQQKEVDKVMQQKDLEVNKLEEELMNYSNETAATIEKRNRKIEKISENKARLATFLVMSIPITLISILLWIAPFIQDSNVSKLIVFSILVIVSVIIPLLGLFNINLIKPIKLIYNWFFNYYKKRVFNKYYS
ncbi:hypothetical protein [Guptibacillus hwajinpoensis]|uniref:hypothetical protein n=1 Tax=Guptibacillus hwajinpoensis TaxID=208199 RepID=UPI0024B33007|nr:hypothetical protein [Pseudalkalibacillus hwajinpoensis]